MQNFFYVSARFLVRNIFQMFSVVGMIALFQPFGNRAFAGVVSGERRFRNFEYLQQITKVFTADQGVVFAFREASRVERKVLPRADKFRRRGLNLHDSDGARPASRVFVKTAFGFHHGIYKRGFDAAFCYDVSVFLRKRHPCAEKQRGAGNDKGERGKEKDF